MASVDISIRGAGIFGLTIAWECVQRGAKVELVDPVGAGAGASGGIVGALAPHVPENWNPKKQFQFESLLYARVFWPAIAAASGHDPGYVQSGRVQPLATEAAVELAKARAVSARQLWQGVADWTITREAEGWQMAGSNLAYVKDTLSAHIHPKRACLALEAALRICGVDVVPEALAKTASTVWATGAAGLDQIGQALQANVGQGIKGQAALLQLDMRGAPQLFADGLHFIPHGDGTVAVGSTTERLFEGSATTDLHLEEVLTRARHIVPDLKNAKVLQRWAGLRPRARSRAPMLGAWPGRNGHFVANGGFKIGFGMAPRVAQAMADLLIDGTVTYPPEFDVSANISKSA